MLKLVIWLAALPFAIATLVYLAVIAFVVIGSLGR